MSEQADTPSKLEIALAFVFVCGVIIGVYYWVTRPIPAPQPTQVIDLSSKNIGNKVGKEAGDFTKGFIRGILGKDKNGNPR